MSLFQDENQIKTIISEIAQECARRGHDVSVPVVDFMVKAVVLDPSNEFNVDRTLTKEDVQKLEELCLDKLMEKHSPFLDTIKMQVYFDMNYTCRHEFLEEIHRQLESKLSPVRREIAGSRVRGKEELDALYRQMITYILLWSGLGSSTDSSTVHEATAALQSIFPSTELGAFMVLSENDKEQQLSELAMIVTGMRLFNRAIKKEEEELDFWELMPAVLHGASEGLEEELSVSQCLVWKYTALVETLTLPDAQAEEWDVSPVLLKQALYNVRQYEAFLQMLHANTDSCSQRVEKLESDFSSQMNLLKEKVQINKAMLTTKVFPHFKTLSQLWTELHDETELLNIFINLALQLQPFLSSQAEIFPEVRLDSLLEGSVVKTDKERLSESSGEHISPAEVQSEEWLLPETTEGFSELPLQYNGVCGYTLVNTDGLLVPGNPSIGVLKHKDKFYVFNNKDAALKFAASPDEFITAVAEKVKGNPELIHLLKLHQQFASFMPRSEVRREPMTKCESGTQTDVHPLETNIVKSYEWNEWELRRKAIKLTDLGTKVTHSTQTGWSHMKRENVTQTWLPKDAASQTKRDGESNVPKPLVYLMGLRGRSVGHVVKTDLTRSVDD